jgi:hypothetical protein
MDDKIILLCCSGRSGSTTLQRMLNIIPNSNICGENYGAINSLLLFYKKIKQTTYIQVPGNKKPVSYDELIKNNYKPAWYNSYDFEEIKNSVRNTIIKMFKKSDETNVWGFKEIRYEQGNINLIKEFKELFPQTKVIIQIREDIAKQSKSSWFKNNPNSLKYLNNLNNELYRFYYDNRDFCYFTTFEKMFDKENIKKIFKFIDCEKHYNETSITNILNNNIKD